jgi:hypothetical protein
MSSVDLHAQRELFLPLLRGESIRWPQDLDLAVFFELAQFHGVTCLLLESLSRLEGVPAAVIQRLQGMGRERAMWELRNRQLMREAIDALAQAGIPSLVFKGTALAYSLYTNPVWRMRSDSDVLISEDKLACATAVLQRLGYRQYGASEEMIFYKIYFEQSMPEGGVHNIDLHWRFNNSELLSGLFRFEQLLQRSVPVPALGSEVRAPCEVDALLIACLHRGVHHQAVYTVGQQQHYTGDRYIWLKDIDLLLRQLSPAQWSEFVVAAHERGVVQICRDSVTLSARLYGTPLPATWQQDLPLYDEGQADRYILAGQLGRVSRDFCACSGGYDKLRFIARQLLPPVEYMRHKYADARMRWLPWLYLRRIVAGVFLRARGLAGHT